jgi:hypothetical protein
VASEAATGAQTAADGRGDCFANQHWRQNIFLPKRKRFLAFQKPKRTRICLSTTRQLADDAPDCLLIQVAVLVLENFIEWLGQEPERNWEVALFMRGLSVRTPSPDALVGALLGTFITTFFAKSKHIHQR